MLNEQLIIQDYLSGMSLRKVASIHNTNHHMVKRILVRNNIEIRQPLRCVGLRKYESKDISRYGNMAHHLRFNVSASWLIQFPDYEKLKFLNRQITNRDGRFDVSTEWYKAFINKFYFDDNFNRLYKQYLDSGQQKYLKPSLDHITPRSLNGTNEIDNLRFVTYLENMCKRNIPYDDWVEIRKNITQYFI